MDAIERQEARVRLQQLLEGIAHEHDQLDESGSPLERLARRRALRVRLEQLRSEVRRLKDDAA